MKAIQKNNPKQIISVIAGGGDLPLRIIEKLNSLNIKHNVVSLANFGPEGYPQFKIGEVGKILEFVKSEGTTDIVFCGNVKRPSLFSLNLDSVGRSWLKALGLKVFLGDDAFLKGIKELLKKEGLNVVSPQGILNTLITPEGVLTKTVPSDVDLLDIARGMFVLNAMSKADVGQAVVVQEGIVLGIEASEGTQRLIERCADLKLTESKGGVLVKTSKINQEQSIDLPTIGKNTILQVESAKLTGIAVGARRSQIIDFDETINFANKKNIFIIGV